MDPPSPTLKMKQSAALFVLCMTPIAESSAALTYSSQYGLDTQLNVTQLNVTEINETGSLSKFDSNLGTLVGATLTLYGGANFTIALTNTSLQSQSVRATATATLIFTSNELQVNGQIEQQKPEIVLSAATGAVTIPSGQTSNFGPYAKSASFNYDLNSILASVQSPGGGSFSINATSVSGLTVLGGGGNVSASQSTFAGAGAMITYTYVPEPTSTSPLLCGMAGLGLLIRRRR